VPKLVHGRTAPMAHHEASTTVDVAANILFDYLADIEHLPDYLPRLTELHPTTPEPAEAQGIEARRPSQPVRREVEVTATEASGRTHRAEAWLEVVEEKRKLQWGVPGEPPYHGELEVDFVADGTSKLTVRLDTSHPENPAVDEELRRALDGIRTSLEQVTAREGDHD
jgi:polyketide cyclase/dehydrase/lipid transport protein